MTTLKKLLTGLVVCLSTSVILLTTVLLPLLRSDKETVAEISSTRRVRRRNMTTTVDWLVPLESPHRMQALEDAPEHQFLRLRDEVTYDKRYANPSVSVGADVHGIVQISLHSFQ